VVALEAVPYLADCAPSCEQRRVCDTAHRRRSTRARQRADVPTGSAHLAASPCSVQRRRGTQQRVQRDLQALENGAGQMRRRRQLGAHHASRQRARVSTHPSPSHPLPSALSTRGEEVRVGSLYGELDSQGTLGFRPSHWRTHSQHLIPHGLVLSNRATGAHTHSTSYPTG
jgi:hypothetical protein